jgi:diadenosine tetraphosphate (Ap4A) HIT family hydrolase
MSTFQPLESDASFQPACELCREAGGVMVFQARRWRVIRVEDEAFPAFYRVVWRAHVREWTDLSLAHQAEVLGVVDGVERVLRAALAPAKINLASLGNMTPHLHWHVIARFDWDARWPAPVWAPALRAVPDAASRLPLSLKELDQVVADAVSAVVTRV